MARPRVHLLRLLFVLIVLLPSLASAADGGKNLRRITIVSVSDWHAQLEPISLTIDDKQQQVGGAAILKYYFDQERQRNPRGTLIVTAGDAFGATPPLSSFFEDVPGIEAQNAMGFNIDTLGNHSFDYGLDRLRKLMDQAKFPYVAANIVGRDGRTIAPPYRIFTKNGVKVGVIGIGHPRTPEVVFPGRTGDYQFLDPVPVINQHAKRLRRQGAHLVIVIAHIGADAIGADGMPLGPLGDVANAVKGVDVLIGDHSDVSVNTVVNKVIVVENKSKGVQYAVIDIEYDIHKKAILTQSVTQKRPLVEGATPDKNVQAIIDKYQAKLQPLFDQKVGETAMVLSRSRQEESLLGNLETDILRKTYQTQLAFDASGALRSDIPSSYQPANKTLRRTGSGYAAGPPYDIVQGDFFSVFPFGNVAVTFKITGKVLWEALENGLSHGAFEGGKFANTAGRFPQISGFKYHFDPRKPAGERIVSVTLADGTPIPKDNKEYTVVTGDFVFYGGDGFTMLNTGSGTTRELVADTISRVVQQMGTISVKSEGRITRVETSSQLMPPPLAPAADKPQQTVVQANGLAQQRYGPANVNIYAPPGGGWGTEPLFRLPLAGGPRIPHCGWRN
ncbi:MAG: 5'-nucleotidase C-terminal domain-containing protein [Nitrospinae bacterium]|nr:5'-nucleotidase C-terminal domain-containing protein [Nitrospinota bacterium]